MHGGHDPVDLGRLTRLYSYTLAVDGDGKRIDTSWYDRLKDGTPWEFKATAHRHADGNPGNFKIYEKYHAKLQQ